MYLHSFVGVLAVLLCAEFALSTTMKTYHRTAYPNKTKTLYPPYARKFDPLYGYKKVIYNDTYNITYYIKSEVPDQPIKMVFKVFDLSRGCSDDSLEIWDQGRLLYNNYDSEITEKIFESKSDAVEIRFLCNKDGNDFRFGFIIDYMSIGNSSTTSSGGTLPTIHLPGPLGQDLGHGGGAADIEIGLFSLMLLVLVAMFTACCS